MAGKYIFSFLVSGMKYLKRILTITIKNHSISDKNHNEVHTRCEYRVQQTDETHKIRFQATKKIKINEQKILLAK
jgi:hypothetical protein